MGVPRLREIVTGLVPVTLGEKCVARFDLGFGLGPQTPNHVRVL